MRHTRYLGSFAPLAALGAGGLAGYYLARVQDRARERVVSPRSSLEGRGKVVQGVSTTSPDDGTFTVRTTGPSSESTWKCPQTRV